MRSHRRRNARPNENDIATVRVVRRRNPLGAPLTASQVTALQSILASHGVARNPKRKSRRVKARKVRRTVKRKTHKSSKRKVRRTVKRKTLKVPKGKRNGSVFKRKGRWFRVSTVKVRRGQNVIRRRVVRKTTARAARRVRK